MKNFWRSQQKKVVTMTNAKMVNGSFCYNAYGKATIDNKDGRTMKED
jgi:hypothetical protein